MKFVLYGNGEVPYCSEVHHQRSLQDLGHECRILQENRVPTDIVLREALECDALIWIHTHGVANRGRMHMGTVLDTLRTAGIPSIAYHLDAYIQIPDRWAQYQNDLYMRKLDHFFTVDQCHADWLNNNTDVKGHYLPPGVYSKECYISDQPSPYGNDVLFTGSYGYHDSYPMRPKLIDWLHQTYGSRFTHIGGGSRTGVGTIRGAELNALYANSKVVVGDSFICDPNYAGKYWSDRVPEVLGRGGVLLAPWVYGLDEQFTDGEHLLTYEHGNFIDLRIKIDWLIAHSAERESMRVKGHAHAKATATYATRWQTILDTVFA